MLGNWTKTEKFLTLCAMLFLLALSGRFAWDTTQIRDGGVMIETEYRGAAEEIAPLDTGKLDLNTATAAELELLPGIGPVLAERIIDYRAENGAFETADALQNVKGIGPGIYEGLAERITVGGESAPAEER